MSETLTTTDTKEDKTNTSFQFKTHRFTVTVEGGSEVSDIEVQFNETGLNLVYGSNDEKDKNILYENILSCEQQSITADSGTLCLHVYESVEGSCCSDPARRYHTVHFTARTDAAKELKIAIDKAINFNIRSFLVLVNPASGDGSAVSVWESVQAMFTQAQHKVEVIKTTHAGHASDYVKTMPLDKYDSIAIVSGDGLMYEVVNGLMQRQDWRLALETLSLGLIPGGSGNGSAKSVCSLSQQLYSVSHVAFIIAKGQTRKMDMYSVRQEEEELQFGVLCVSWGLISDIDSNSEKWRCCGGFRFIPGAIAGICCLNTYQASISYLLQESPAQQDESLSFQNQPSNTTDLTTTTCCPGCPCISGDDNELDALEALVTLHHRTSSQNNEEEKLTESKEVCWQNLDEVFSLVWLLNLPDPASDFHAGPYTHSSNGAMDLVYSTEANCCSLMGQLPSVASGEYIDSNSVETLRVKAIRLTPAPVAKTSLIMADGEALPQKPTTIEVFRKILNTFCF